MPRESHLEFKVGFFIVLAFIGFVVFIFSVSDSSVFEKGDTLKVVFKFANGLKRSAPVRIAGVDEGIVKDIKLFFDEKDGIIKAEVEMWIKKGIRIPSDSVVIINQLGLMGEKYVEIMPGINREEFLRNGQKLIGKDPISQEAISEKIMQVSEKLDGVAGGLKGFIQDDKNTSSLSKTLENLSAVTGNFNQVMIQINKGEGTIGKLLYDNAIYEDLKGLTADLKQNPWKLLYKPR
ncbi:MAG TPA: MlaD family protein [Candidatus Omnitrophota bacterium]|nr:MlaD family protein [Candidatus Omnitrophota bacterium]